MPDWRDRILQSFTPGTARLTLAADTDGLLLKAALQEALRGRGLEIVTVEDPVAFRFDYESRFRSRWDRGEGDGSELVVRTDRHDPSALPHDLLQTGRRLSFGLGDLFPAFNHPVVAALDRSGLDALHRAQERHKPGRLGDDAIKDFALRHVFDLAPELVKTPPDLLRVLLRRHYRGQHLPRPLDDRLTRPLRQGGAFASWPLESILPDRDAFSAFLQERWPPFLDRLAGVPSAAGLQGVGRGAVSRSEGPLTCPSTTTMSASMSTTCSSKGCCVPFPTRPPPRSAANGRRSGSASTRTRTGGGASGRWRRRSVPRSPARRPTTGTGSRSPGVGRNSAPSCRRPPPRRGRRGTRGSPGFKRKWTAPSSPGSNAAMRASTTSRPSLRPWCTTCRAISPGGSRTIPSARPPSSSWTGSPSTSGSRSGRC